jgi:serine/threonine protein kinase
MLLTCPARDDLSSFALGKLPEDRSQEIAEHLEECSHCQAQLGTVGDSGDTLLAGLRRDARSEFDQETALRRAIQRIEQFGRDPSFSRAGASSEPSSATAPDTIHSGPTEWGTIGSYRLLAKLGEGGMGAVYKALHVHLEKVVAIKVLPADRLQDPAAVARFRREMKVVGQLDHPHLVHAFDAGEVDGRHFLAMEYVQGLDLSTLARRHGPLRVADACELVRQAALGLQAAHERGLVHRDIKPANLMLAQMRNAEFGMRNEEGQNPSPNSAFRIPNSAFVKVLDLGLALLHDDAGQLEPRDLTSTGQFMGTVDYMAPEQAGDSHGVDIKADIYSLGATLYKLLTGEAPFAGPKYPTLISKMMALANESPAPLRQKRHDAPAELEAVLARMLHREAGKRYAAPAEVAAALAPFCAGADPAALLLSVADSLRKSERPQAERVPHTGDSPPATISTAPVSSQLADSQIDRSPHAPREVPVGRASDPSVPLRETGQRPVLRRSHHAERDAYKRYQRILAGVAAVLLVVLGVFLIVRTPNGEVIVELGEGVKAEEVKIEISGDGDRASPTSRTAGRSASVKAATTPSSPAVTTSSPSTKSRSS